MTPCEMGPDTYCCAQQLWNALFQILMHFTELVPNQRAGGCDLVLAVAPLCEYSFFLAV